MAQHRLGKQGKARNGTGNGSDGDAREAEPILHQKAREIQKFGQMIHIPIGLDEKVRKQSVDALNPILADTITLRDLYKKHHWQVAGPTFYQGDGR